MSSPHDFLTITAEVAPELARDVEQALQTAEIKAVESATPTPGVEEFLAACKDAGRQLAIVSNNTGASVTRLPRASRTDQSCNTSRPATHRTQA